MLCPDLRGGMERNEKGAPIGLYIQTSAEKGFGYSTIEKRMLLGRGEWMAKTFSTWMQNYFAFEFKLCEKLELFIVIRGLYKTSQREIPIAL